jgi:hypothetical protein
VVTSGKTKRPFAVFTSACVILLSCALSTAKASPTVTIRNTVLTTDSCPVYAPATVSGSIDNFLQPANAKLARLAREFLQPPVHPGSQGFIPVVKPLPAVPPAIFVLLSGFLCVSLVKDRRVWLSALAALLWAGHNGFHALPQLALRLAHRTNNVEHRSAAQLTYSYYLENSRRPRSDIEGTQYIGLLHHLAGIPNALNPSPFCPRSTYFNTSGQTYRRTGASQSAIIRLSSHVIIAHNRTASLAEQPVSFSPAFIFDNLPRGPPLYA